MLAPCGLCARGPNGQTRPGGRLYRPPAARIIAVTALALAPETSDVRPARARGRRAVPLAGRAHRADARPRRAADPAATARRSAGGAAARAGLRAAGRAGP